METVAATSGVISMGINTSMVTMDTIDHTHTHAERQVIETLYPTMTFPYMDIPT